jgi:lipopolysaccharide/colanic/teichoic acid biosynthesis glycosyltransferase
VAKDKDKDKAKKSGEKSLTAGIPEVSAILVEEGLPKRPGEQSVTAGIPEVSAILIDEGGRGTQPSPAPSAPPPLPKKRQATQMGVAPPANHPSEITAAPEGAFPPPQRRSSRPPPRPEKGSTLIGGSAPPPLEPIVPRRRTPAAGMPAANQTLIGGAAVVIQPPAPPAPIRVEEKRGSDPMVPPVIRIGGGAAAPPSSRSMGSLLCEILLRNGDVTQEAVDKAIAQQEERGGQIGRILVSLGACTEEAIARGLLEQLRVRKKTGYDTDISVAARENKDVAGLKVLTRPELTIAVLLVTDIIGLLFAALLASSVHWIRTYGELGQIDWSSWLVVGPAIALCLLTFLGLELYSPMAKSTPDEIRDVVFAASLVHLGASILSTLGDLPIVKWGVFVRGVWWIATLFTVPVLRSIVRNKFSMYAWWGIPVCVLGAAKTGRLIVRTLKAQPRSGLKPVMMLDDDPSKHGTLRASFSNEQMDVYSVNVGASAFMNESTRKALAEDIFGGGVAGEEEVPAPVSSDHIPITHVAEFLGPESQRKPKVQPRDASLWPRGKFAEVEGVPVIGDLTLAPVLAQRLKIPYAVVAMPGVDSQKLVQIVERIGGKFSHLLIIPDLFGFATMGVPAKSLGGILGVEVRQQLLLPGPRLAKRVMDVALTSIGAIFVLPFLLLIAALTKLDSRGSIFYTQKRLGRDGEHFKAYKFRTMHGDGEERLKAILDADPQLRAEYEIYHKLKKDPRVTRVGRILRKFSLDEFPQLLNVIKGDMSLVGPRPYIERELTEMGGQEKIILRAPPGMTGMWQVSDRNATSFLQRVQIDVYYVRNWSPWLDIHILAKTFGVVIKGSGV